MIYKNYKPSKVEHLQDYKSLLNSQKDKNMKMVAEYAIHPQAGTFSHMELVPDTRTRHDGATRTLRKEVIDFSVPRAISNYDKLGCKLLIQSVKHYLFGSKNVRMPKEKCEAFFDNSANFA